MLLKVVVSLVVLLYTDAGPLAEQEHPVDTVSEKEVKLDDALHSLDDILSSLPSSLKGAALKQGETMDELHAVDALHALPVQDGPSDKFLLQSAPTNQEIEAELADILKKVDSATLDM